MTTEGPIDPDPVAAFEATPDLPGPVSKVTPAPEPGLYLNVDYDTYASWDAVRSSTLCDLRRTPAHARYRLERGGKPQTKALEIGWLTHLAILEPERFHREAMLGAKVDGRTKAGKAQLAAMNEQAAGRRILLPHEWDQIASIQRAVYTHPTAGEFLRSEGACEVSIVWIDSETQVLCKARIDRLGMVGMWPIVGDLKTTENASKAAFERSVYNLGYFIQAAHYLDGINTIAPLPYGSPFRRFVFVALEKEEPYLVACHELAEEALHQGQLERRRSLRLWRKCVESGEWPGYDDGIDLVGLPAWAFRAVGESLED